MDVLSLCACACHADVVVFCAAGPSMLQKLGDDNAGGSAAGGATKPTLRQRLDGGGGGGGAGPAEEGIMQNPLLLHKVGGSMGITVQGVGALPPELGRFVSTAVPHITVYRRMGVVVEPLVLLAAHALAGAGAG
jgi:hypothetical protein